MEQLQEFEDRLIGGQGRFAALRDRLEGPNTIGNSPMFWRTTALIGIILVVYPLLRNPYTVSNRANILSFVLLGLSLGIIWGYTGIFSFGQVAFFGVSGYIYGIVAINVAHPMGTMLGVLVAVATSVIFALTLGYFMFYGGIGNVYVAIITLAVTLVLQTFMAGTAGSEWAIGDAHLGGFNGMTNIPNLAVGTGDAVLVFEGMWYYYLVVALVAIAYLGLRALVNSDYGYVMVAIREQEERTELFGYNTRLIKLLIFGLGGALAGMSGVLYASWGNFISPGVFSLSYASLPVIWVAVGGRKTLLGAVSGSFVVQLFSQRLAYSIPSVATIILGATLLLVILVFPEGAIPQLHERLCRLQEGGE